MERGSEQEADPVTEAWEDEGFGGENDWGDESVESDLEEDDALEPEELEGDAESWDDDGGEHQP